MAADIALQFKRANKSMDKDILIQRLDRKRKELREIHNKTTSQTIECAELKKIVKERNDEKEHEKRSWSNPFLQAEKEHNIKINWVERKPQCIKWN